MKSIFLNNHLHGIMVFSHKSHWKSILRFLAETLGSNRFFFFFDSERGYHLKIVSQHFSVHELEQLTLFLAALPHSAESQREDPLFMNAPANTLHSMPYFNQSADIKYAESLLNDTMIDFLKQLSTVIIDALQYNDFFIEEKNRINFAIQLLFLALVKADKPTIKAELETFIAQTTIEAKSPLLAFYHDVLEIEKEEKIEIWVQNWLKSSELFLKQASFSTMVESIVTILEIKSFKTKLLSTTLAVLSF